MNDQHLQQLHERQMQEFELARKNFDGLRQVVYRDIDCGNFSIRVQYNPARMISTNANIERSALEQRPCFLCKAHLPASQKGLSYRKNYHIFVNPYPIFGRHYTVPANAHIPQAIAPHFPVLLELAADFPDYTVFYNGPECGASAPDHFHFQMVSRHLMPLEKEVLEPKLQEIIRQEESYSQFRLKDYFREVFVIRTADFRLLVRLFQNTRQAIGEVIPFQDEPMMNILVWFEQGVWTCCIFPRQKRRPWQFFAEGNEKILFSPGCVDIAGVIVAPRREDFERYSAPLLADLFGQVTITPEQRESIIQKLKKTLP